MAYRRRRAGEVLNLTPLIDLVFLLLIYFLLTAHFVEEQAIEIALPETVKAQPVKDDGVVEVLLAPDGRILVDGQPVTLVELEETLRGALHAPGVRFVRLRGDDAAQFGLGVKIIEAARAAGAEAVDILTERP